MSEQETLNRVVHLCIFVNIGLVDLEHDELIGRAWEREVGRKEVKMT